MLIAGTNFALFVHVFRGDLRQLIDNTEFRSYLLAVAGFGTVLSAVLFVGVGLAETPSAIGLIPGNLENALRQGLFQVTAILTTTGYASMDVNTWSEGAQLVLLFAYFLGGSAGSAAGSIKIVRWVVAKKAVGRMLFTSIHPDTVNPIRLDGGILDEKTVRDVLVFVVLFVAIFVVSTVLLYLDSLRTPELSLSAIEATSVTIATLGNIGPGFGVVGPMNNFQPFSNFSKCYMVFLMWIGRLEILAVAVILTPSFWRR
jgi:trk system potassium uptake protein TrkH